MGCYKRWNHLQKRDYAEPEKHLQTLQEKNQNIFIDQRKKTTLSTKKKHKGNTDGRASHGQLTSAPGDRMHLRWGNMVV